MTEICINTYIRFSIDQIDYGEVLVSGKFITISMKVIEIINKEIYLKEMKESGMMCYVNRSIHNPDLNFYRVRILD